MRGPLRDHDARHKDRVKTLAIPLLKGLYYRATLLVVGFAYAVMPFVRWLRHKSGGRFNSLWAGTPILTLPLKARAEALLGVNAKSLVYQSYGIAQGGFDIHLGSLTRIPVLGRLVPWGTFLYACATQDRLHFFSDRGLLPVRRLFLLNRFELAVYKFLGIQVFFWTYGGDVRVREATLTLGEPNCCTFCPAVGTQCVCTNNRAAYNRETIRRYATAHFSMGDMIHYTPGSRNDVFFWPVDLLAQQGSKYEPSYPDVASPGPVKIVHAANHRAFKGTHLLIQAIDELRSQGVAVELVLVEGVPNHIALAQYRAADVIFDQCLIGFHGYFALEGMALGKPVMSFLRLPSAYVLAADECPIINTSISTLKEDVLKLCGNRANLRELGVRGRRYVEKYYTIEAVSRRMASAYAALEV